MTQNQECTKMLRVKVHEDARRDAVCSQTLHGCAPGSDIAKGGKWLFGFLCTVDRNHFLRAKELFALVNRVTRADHSLDLK